jgi:post-segregation antitoxin (ccd killing protein)
VRRYDPAARKRPVTLLLNEDLVARAQRLNGDLSGLVEHLLTSFVERPRQADEGHLHSVRQAVAGWNAHGKRYGSIADDHLPL